MTTTWQLKCWNSMHIHNNSALHYLYNMAVGLVIYSRQSIQGQGQGKGQKLKDNAKRIPRPSPRPRINIPALIVPNFIALRQTLYEKSFTKSFTPFSILAHHGTPAGPKSPTWALIYIKARTTNMQNFVPF